MTAMPAFTETMDAVIAFFERPDIGWCRYALARDPASQPIHECESAAVSFCVEGGVNRVFKDNGWSEIDRVAFLDALHRALNQGRSRGRLHSWNDRDCGSKIQLIDVLKHIRDVAATEKPQSGDVWTRPGRPDRTIVKATDEWVIYTINDPDPTPTIDRSAAWAHYVANGGRKRT